VNIFSCYILEARNIGGWNKDEQRVARTLFDTNLLIYPEGNKGSGGLNRFPCG
jgi:hypothetical protein